jgi:hypothetical protein
LGARVVIEVALADQVIGEPFLIVSVSGRSSFFDRAPSRMFDLPGDVGLTSRRTFLFDNGPKPPPSK